MCSETLFVGIKYRILRQTSKTTLMCLHSTSIYHWPDCAMGCYEHRSLTCLLRRFDVTIVHCQTVEITFTVRTCCLLLCRLLNKCSNSLRNWEGEGGVQSLAINCRLQESLRLFTVDGDTWKGYMTPENDVAKLEFKMKSTFTFWVLVLLR